MMFYVIYNIQLVLYTKHNERMITGDVYRWSTYLTNSAELQFISGANDLIRKYNNGSPIVTKLFEWQNNCC